MHSNPRRLLIAIALLSVVAAGSWAAGLKASVARERIAKALGFDKTDPVHVTNISVSGSEAVVEADIKAVFRFSTDKNGNWNPVELRTGDRRWESLELIETGIRKEKALRTTADLRTIATAIDAYRRERGSYVTATGGLKLMDQLSPTYLKTLLMLDAWSREFEYNGTGSTYRLSSRGPDGKSDTDDDIVFQDGRLVKGAVE